MPLFHVHGLVASTLATLATGGTVVVPAKFNPLSFWRMARDHGVTWYSAVPTLHQLLLARAEAGAPQTGRRREAALHPLVQRVAAAAGDARSRGRLRRARARGVRHDRSRASDGVQSLAAGGTQARIGRAGHRRPHQHHATARAGISPPGERGEVVHQGPECHHGLREQPRSQRDGVLRRVVPHRRPGISRRATAI